MKDRHEITLFLDLRLAERGWSAATRAAYQRDLGLLADYLGELTVQRFQDLTIPLILDFLKMRREVGDSLRTLNRRSAAIRSFCRFLNEEEILADDLNRDLPPAHRTKNLPHFLDSDEMASLLEAPHGKPAIVLRDRALIELLYGSGIRVSELTGLEASHLRPSPHGEGLIVWVRGKGGKERQVPLHATASEAIAAYLATGRPELTRPNGSTRLFLSIRGAALSRRAVYEVLRRLGQVAGITQNVTPHLLRHTFATHLVHEGADLRAVGELLGHAQVSTTTIYTSVDTRRLRELHSQFHPRGRKR
jgi:integrase/recombinase XerD